MKIRAWIFTFFLIAVFGGKAWSASLDNSAWAVIENGRRVDTLVFVNGQFTATDHIYRGFYTGPYIFSQNGETLRWNATQMNRAGQTMDWKGEVTKNIMKVTCFYHDEVGTPRTKQWTAKKIEK